ncbi:DUF5317 domain-containing protein [Tindallia californiensis]|uniref:Uncharacterized protein n=1 Tax=Tindallia californiensis TaxID=159292 RepID=A0A1H3L9A0_9FIRM|nr:DUF5317 domain-containing protein [Tindallia californiensis]SDY60961.1 hypothetical protein SAMN05192546_103119 [Tindallia californiensis]
MFIEALVLGTVVAFFRGGTVKNMRLMHIRMPVLLIAAFLLQLVLSFMMLAGSTWFIHHRMLLYALSYGMLFIALFFNLGHKVVWFIIAGSIMNFAVIFLSNGTILISADALQQAGFLNRLSLIEAGRLPHYTLIEETTTLMSFFAKRFTPPSFYPVAQIFSPGDLFISLGLFFWIQHLFLGVGHYQRARMLQVDHHGKFLKR